MTGQVQQPGEAAGGTGELGRPAGQVGQVAAPGGQPRLQLALEPEQQLSRPGVEGLLEREGQEGLRASLAELVSGPEERLS